LVLLLLLSAVFLSGMFLSAIPALAADWKILAEDTEGIPVYYDAEGVAHAAGSAVYKVWTKIVNKKGLLPIPEYEYYDEALHLVEIDCETRVHRTTKGQILDEKGDVAATYLNEPNARWEPIEPGTLGDTLADAICPKPEKKK
jgi:hypothetical protein